MSSDNADDKWAEVVFNRLKERNREQTEPFVDIFKSNTRLWYEQLRLRSLLTDTKHQLSILQHDLASVSASAAVDGIKGRLSQLQGDLRERSGFDGSNERKVAYDLMKRVRDQEKLLARQAEEVVVAKRELSASLESVARLDADLHREKRECAAASAEVEALRKTRASLEAENAQLISRILADRARAADEMNELVDAGTRRLQQEERQRQEEQLQQAQAADDGEERSPPGRAPGPPPTFHLPASSIVHPCLPHGAAVNDVVASATGHIFTVAGVDAVHVFETSTGRALRALTCGCPVLCLDMVEAPAAGAAGERHQVVLAGGADGTCRLWNAATGAALQQMQGLEKVYCCRFLGRGLAATASADRSIKLWDVEHSGHAVWSQRTSSSVYAVCGTHDLATVVSGHHDGSLRVWAVAGGGASAHVADKVHSGRITHVAASSNGRHLLVASAADNALSLVDTRTYAKVHAFKVPPGFRMVPSDWARVCLSPDGSFAAAGGADGTVTVWDVGSGAVAAVLSIPSSGAAGITAVQWTGGGGGGSSGGRGGIFAGTKAGAVLVWS